MLEIARERAKQLGREADLRVGDAEALDFPDQHFDTVICTLALCSIPDDREAVREAKRVLRPGGRFLALEHVASPAFPVRAVQSVLRLVHRALRGRPPPPRSACPSQKRGPRDGTRGTVEVGIVLRVAARAP